MQLWEAILHRRTIKDFTTQPVPGDVLARVLEAGRWAQNHKLTQPWRFTVLGPQTHQLLAEDFAEAQAGPASADDPAGRERRRADALGKITAKPQVVALSQTLAAGDSAEARREDYGAVSCAAQNIQLAAWAEGLGMQWSSGKIIRLPGTYRVLGIDPAAEEIVGLLFFGYPAKVPPAPARRMLEEVTRHLP